MLEISPTFGTARYALGLALLLQGQTDAALAEFQKETDEDGRPDGLAMVYFLTGRKAASDAAVADAVKAHGEEWPFEIARVYAFRGDRDQAFKWLEKAYTVHDPDLYMFKGDPLMDRVRDDPRYAAFLRKMHLSE